jgi:hypothetical protein
MEVAGDCGCTGIRLTTTDADGVIATRDDRMTIFRHHAQVACAMAEGATAAKSRAPAHIARNAIFFTKGLLSGLQGIVNVFPHLRGTVQKRRCSEYKRIHRNRSVACYLQCSVVQRFWLKKGMT